MERNEALSSLYIFHKCVYYQSNNTNRKTKLLEFGMQTCAELIGSQPTSHWPAYFHFVFLHGGEKKTPDYEFYRHFFSYQKCQLFTFVTVLGGEIPVNDLFFVMWKWGFGVGDQYHDGKKAGTSVLK